MVSKKKRLKRGVDFDGWTVKFEDGRYYPFVRPTKEKHHTWMNYVRIHGGINGCLVRVKFVEVKS